MFFGLLGSFFFGHDEFESFQGSLFFGFEVGGVGLGGEENVDDFLVDDLVVLVQELDLVVEDEVLHQQVQTSVLDVPL